MKSMNEKQTGISRYYFLIMYAVLSIVIVIAASSPEFIFYEATLDFRAFVTGAKIISNNETGTLYDLPTQQRYQRDLMKQVDIFDEEDQIPVPTERNFLPFLNPPIVAAMFLPFAKMPLYQGYALYLIIELIVLLIAIYKIWEQFSEGTEIPMWVIMFSPILYTVLFGQISHIILLLLVANFAYRKRSLSSGFLTGLIFLKLQWLIFGWYFFLVAKNKIKYMLGLVVSVSLMLLMNVSIYGTNFITEYPRHLLDNENSIPGLQAVENFNLQGIRAAYTEKGISVQIAVVGILVYVIWLAFMKYKKVPEDLVFGSAILLGLVFNIHTMAADLVYLLIPLAVLYKIKERVGSMQMKALYLCFFLSPLLGFVKLQWLSVLIFLVIAMFFMRASSAYPELFEEV